MKRSEKCVWAPLNIRRKHFAPSTLGLIGKINSYGVKKCSGSVLVRIGLFLPGNLDREIFDIWNIFGFLGFQGSDFLARNWPMCILKDPFTNFKCPVRCKKNKKFDVRRKKLFEFLIGTLSHQYYKPTKKILFGFTGIKLEMIWLSQYSDLPNRIKL